MTFECDRIPTPFGDASTDRISYAIGSFMCAIGFFSYSLHDTALALDISSLLFFLFAFNGRGQKHIGS
jgi:hypothetical protein